MSNRLKLIVVLLALATGLTIVPGLLSAADYAPPHQKPGPATETLRFQSFNVDLASESLKAGAMDAYFFSLKTDARCC